METQTYNGAQYQRNSPNEPWTKIPSAATNAPPAFIPPDPNSPRALERQADANRQDRRDARLDAKDARTEAREDRRDARTEAEFNGTGGTGSVDQSKIATLTTRIAGGLSDIEGVLKPSPNAAAPGFVEGVKGDLAPGGLTGMVNRKIAGGPRRAVVDAQRDMLDAMLTLGTGAAYAQEQLDAAVAAHFPQYGDGPEEIQIKDQRLRRVIAAAKANAGPAWLRVEPMIEPFLQGIAVQDGADAAAGADKSTKIIDPNAPITPRGPNYQAGPVESYVTDADRQRTQKLQEAYNNGAGPGELNRLAAELGVQAFPADDMRALMEARQRGVQAQITPFASGKQGMIESAISTVADSPVGAYGIGAANALTLGGLDEVAGLMGGESAGQRAQFAKDYSRENSPVSSMVGEAAGFVGASMLPGVAGTMASIKGGATLGGIYGGLDTNDNRLLGAGFGAVTGGAANKYAPQVMNALTQFAQPAVQGTRNALTAVSNRLPGAEGRAIARQEVAQNADVIAAGQAENIPVRQPDVRPSLRDQYGGAEASQYGGPKIQKAASEDAQAIANRIAEIGGSGTTKQGYNLGSATQDAVKAEKSAMSNEASAMYRRVDLQAPGFKTPAFEASKVVGEKIDAIKKLTPEGNEGQISFLQKLENNLTSTGVSVESLQANRDLIRSKMKADNLSFTKAEADLLDVVNAAARDLEKGLQDSGNTAALQSLKRANAKWSEYADFKRDVVKTIVGSKNQPVQPETAAQRLLAMVSSNGSSDKFAKIYNALPADEKAGFKALIAENLGKNARGDFSLALLAKGLDQKNINYKSLREVFTPDEFESLMNLRRLADAKDKAMSGRNFSNTARAANNAPTGFGAFVRGALGFSVGDVAGATAAVAGPSIAERIGTKRTVDMLLNTDFSKWLANMPNTANPRAIDAYLKKLDRIKAPAVASNVVIFKDYLRQTATQSPGKLAASEQEGDGRPIPPQQ